MLSLEWGQLESRNALLTFQSDFRLRKAVSGVYDLTDRLGCSPQRLTLNQRLHAGGLTGCKATEGYTNLTMSISIQLHAPGHKFLAPPELLVSRRNDVVLNKGWHQLFRLQAVGWSKNSSSSVIVFAPTLRCRFLGFENSQHLRFDIILGKTPTAESAVRRLARHKHTHTLLHSAKEPSPAAAPAGSTQAVPGNNAKNALRQQLRQMHTAHDQHTHDSEAAQTGGPRQFKQLVLKKETVLRRWQVFTPPVCVASVHSCKNSFAVFCISVFQYRPRSLRVNIPPPSVSLCCILTPPNVPPLWQKLPMGSAFVAWRQYLTQVTWGRHRLSLPLLP